MVGEPTAVEGAEPLPGTQHAEQASPSQDGAVGQMPPEIAQGTTMVGVNALATPESDLIDALATTAPSPNAPESLGGPLADDSRGRAADTASGEGEAQLATLDDGPVDNSDALKALEEELSQAEEYSNKLRHAADDVAAELHKSATNESELRARIDALRPRSHTMVAIQDYFKTQDAANEEIANARKMVADSGVNLQALQKLIGQSAIDKATSDSNKR
jgi:hypothetical protein